MFKNIPKVPDILLAQVEANEFLQESYGLVSAMPAEIKKLWLKFWDVNQDVSTLQAKVDYLASLPDTDPKSGSANFFGTMCDASLRQIGYCLSEMPDSFDDALVEHKNALQPNDLPYKQFFSTGWYWTIDPTKPSGIAFSSPCIWG